MASYGANPTGRAHWKRGWLPIICAAVALIVILAVVMQDLGKGTAASSTYEMGTGTTEYRWDYHDRTYVLRTNIAYDVYLSYRQDTVTRHADDVAEAVILSKTFVTTDSGVVNNISRAFDLASGDLGLEPRETVNLVLSFVQNIRYVEDEVSVTRDEYWRYPVETLYDRMGDCEDKAFLFASIMEAMGYDAVILFFDGHAAAGIACAGVEGTYYDYDGSKYFYCETTASGWPIGLKPSEYGSAHIAQVE
jgi:prepilin-type processing-associated H-X9-DG protein